MSSPTTQQPGAEAPRAAPTAAQGQGKRAEKRRRDIRAIVDATRALAERGGIDAVRLRDVAKDASVSMGALYRCFQSKEEILLYAFADDFTMLEQRVAARPPEGVTPLDRVEAFFRIATRGIVQRPLYGRAVIAATASGQAAAVRQMSTLHARMSHRIYSAMIGTTSESRREHLADLADDRVDAAFEIASQALNRVWFSELVAWASGLRTVDDVILDIRKTAALLLDGVAARADAHSAAATATGS